MANEISNITVNSTNYAILDAGAIRSTEKGVANGVASLSADGKVPSNQLPSFVDDVIEGYYYRDTFWENSSHTKSIVGEGGKIYVDLTTDKTYRYSGSRYVEISSGGSVVTVEPGALAGEPIATITVDGRRYELYGAVPPTRISELENDSGYVNDVISSITFQTTGINVNTGEETIETLQTVPIQNNITNQPEVFLSRPKGIITKPGYTAYLDGLMTYDEMIKLQNVSEGANKLTTSYSASTKTLTFTIS